MISDNLTYLNIPRQTKCRVRNKAKGLCPRCGNKPLPGKTRCAACTEKRKVYDKRYRLKHKKPITLTVSQQRVFDFIKDYFSKNNRPPSIIEISQGLGIYKNASRQFLLILERKQFIARQIKKHRAWRIIK